MSKDFHPAVDAKEFGRMLNICSRMAGKHIANHPNRIDVGKGTVHHAYRLPYADAVAIATGKQPLPKLTEKPKRAKPTKPRMKPAKAPRDAPRAANGCLYGLKRKPEEA